MEEKVTSLTERLEARDGDRCMPDSGALVTAVTEPVLFTPIAARPSKQLLAPSQQLKALKSEHKILHLFCILISV